MYSKMVELFSKMEQKWNVNIILSHTICVGAVSHSAPSYSVGDVQQLRGKPVQSHHEKKALQAYTTDWRHLDCLLRVFSYQHT